MERDQRARSVTTNCLVWSGVLSISQPRPSVWKSLADYLRDPALELASFRCWWRKSVLLGTMYRSH